MKIKTTVWDGLLRLFHWMLLASIITSYLTIEVFDAIEIHIISGIIISALLTFRILWGFFGSSTSKFSSFFPTPKKIISYLKSTNAEKRNSIGHSALGALSVFALLLSLIIQSISGLLIDDEIYTTGPLNKFVDDSIAELAGEIHHINIDILKVLIALHILAIFFYLFKNKINLIKPMVSGKKEIDQASTSANFILKKPNWIVTTIIIIISVGVGIFLYTI